MQRDTEGSLQHVVSFVLRAGVILAGAVGLIGGVYYLIVHGGEPVSYATFRGEPAQDRLVGLILRDAASLRPRATIQLGILLLILTPIARVVVSLFGFIKERDRTYVTITAIVLITLLASLIGGAIRG